MKKSGNFAGRLPLEGIRIADCTQAWAGPHGTEILAELGAEVIKVEPPYGELTRGTKTPTSCTYPDGVYGARPWNRSCVFNQKNRNKLCVSIDLDKEEGKVLFKRLVKISDIVTDNYAPGVMDRLGVGYEGLQKVKSDIIVASINGYGEGGPWGHYHAVGVVEEPMCGFMALTGYVGDEMPLRSGVDHIDPLSGSHMAGAIMAALLYRRKTGKGQKINVSMLESAINFIGPAILNYTFNGKLLEHRGNRHNQEAMAPHGCYRCKGDDEWVSIAVGSDEEWENFCTAIGKPSWAKASQYSDLQSRLLNQDELDKAVETWTIERDKYQVMHILQKAGVAAGAVLNIEELFSDPQLQARKFWHTVEHTDAGTMTIFGPRFVLSGVPVRAQRPAPSFGEHSAYVFKKLLGLNELEYRRAIESGTIFLEPVESKDKVKHAGRKETGER